MDANSRRLEIVSAVSFLLDVGIVPPWRDVVPAKQQEAQHRFLDRWLDLFEDVPEGVILQASKAHLRDPQRGRFWPTPADIVAQVERLQRARQSALDGPQLSPEEVWPQLKACLSGTYVETEDGPDGAPVQVTPEVRTQRKLAARIGEANTARAWQALGGDAGYRALCGASLEADTADRARFCRAWDAIGQRTRDEVQLAPLLAPPTTTRRLTGGG